MKKLRMLLAIFLVCLGVSSIENGVGITFLFLLEVRGHGRYLLLQFNLSLLAVQILDMIRFQSSFFKSKRSNFRTGLEKKIFFI